MKLIRSSGKRANDDAKSLNEWYPTISNVLFFAFFLQLVNCETILASSARRDEFYSLDINRRKSFSTDIDLESTASVLWPSMNRERKCWDENTVILRSSSNCDALWNCTQPWTHSATFKKIGHIFIIRVEG